MDEPAKQPWRRFPLTMFPAQPGVNGLKAVAVVSAVTADGEQPPGSGFLLHPRLLVTAAHVVTVETSWAPPGPRR